MKKHIALLILVLCFLTYPAHAQNWRGSIGVNQSFNTGELSHGVQPELGIGKDHAQPISVTGRIMYKWVAAELTYKKMQYDIHTPNALVRLDPWEVSARAGIIKEVFGIELIALGGITRYQGNLQVFALTEGGVQPHQTEPISNVVYSPSARVGLGKNINLVKGFTLGIEGGIEYYFIDREYDLCMKFAPSNLEPYVGLKIGF